MIIQKKTLQQNTFYLLFITLIVHVLSACMCIVMHQEEDNDFLFKRKYAFLFSSPPPSAPYKCIIIIPCLASSPECVSFKLFSLFPWWGCMLKKIRNIGYNTENEISEWDNYVMYHIFLYTQYLRILCFSSYTLCTLLIISDPTAEGP